MSEGVAWNLGEVSEETRILILEAGGMKYQMAVFDMLDEIARILQRKDCKRERNRRAVDEARGVLGGQIKRRRQARNA